MKKQACGREGRIPDRSIIDQSAACWWEDLITTEKGSGVEKTNGRRTVSLMRSFAGCEDHATSPVA
jgi:hypothetical protein